LLNTNALYFDALKLFLHSKRLNKADKLKFWLRSWLNKREIGAFLHHMRAQQLEFIFEQHPRLLDKFSRPYLSLASNGVRTLDILCAHYRMLNQSFSHLALETLYQGGLPLCHFTLQDEDFSCLLEYDGQFQKEGEIGISLYQTRPRQRIYTLIAVLDEKSAFVGCLQGGKHQEDNIRRVTKLSHGLRPHNMLVFVAQEVVRALGMQALYGICSAAHVYQARRRTRERIGFDYDTFWQELGGGRWAVGEWASGRVGEWASGSH
jgi:hypothetical protein